MKVIHIDHRFLDEVWAQVAPILAPAVEENLGEATLDQVRAQLVFRQADLLVEVDDEGKPRSAAVIEMIQHPGYRVAHVSYLAGRTSTSTLDHLKSWCRTQGASKIQGYGSEAVSRLWLKYGFTKAYTVMRADI